MSTSARPTESLPARHFVPPNAAALAIDNARLQRELRGLRSRVRIYQRALNDLHCTAKPILVGRETAAVNNLLIAGRLAESFGEVPVIRFARDLVGTIAGVELALLPRDDQGNSSIVALHPGEMDGMAVVGAD